MIWGIIRFIIAIAGIYLILSSYFDEDDSSLTCCCSGIPVLIVMYLFLYFNYKGQLLVLTVIYTIYFIINPEQITNIFDIISSIIEGIFNIISSIIEGIFNIITSINLFKNDEDNSIDDYTDDSSINEDITNNSIKDETSNTKNRNKPSEKNKKSQNNIKSSKVNKKHQKNNNKPSYKNNIKTKNNSHYHLNQLDINKATQEELETTKGITKVTAKKIIDLRRKGIYITSYKLRDFLDISPAEEATIIKNIYISEDMKKEKTTNRNYTKPIKRYDLKTKQHNKTQSQSNKKNKASKKEKNIRKVDINKADFTDINGIPGLTSLMASKIIKLRIEGRYIKSFDDLKDVLGLSQFQLNQIKEYIIITNDLKNSEEKKSNEKTKSTKNESSKKKLSDEDVNPKTDTVIEYIDDKKLHLNNEDSTINKDDIIDSLKSHSNFIHGNYVNNPLYSTGTIDLQRPYNSNHHEVNLNIQDDIRVEDVITNLTYRISSAYNNQTFTNTQKERNEDFNQLEEEIMNKDKIFINSADEEQLSKLPGFHLLNVKKLIKLRQDNIYMNSFNDLVEQIGIDSEYINQLSGIIIFDKVTNNKVTENNNKIKAPKNWGRRIDI